MAQTKPTSLQAAPAYVVVAEVAEVAESIPEQGWVTTVGRVVCTALEAEEVQVD